MIVLPRNEDDVFLYVVFCLVLAAVLLYQLFTGRE